MTRPPQTEPRPVTRPGAANRASRALADLLRGLLAALALLALVGGVPFALVHVASRLQVRLPGSVTDVVTKPDDGSLLLLALLAVGWLAWLVFTTSVLVEVVSLVKGIPAPTLSGIALSQRCAATLVTAVAVMVSPAASFATAASADTATIARTVVEPAPGVRTTEAVAQRAHGSTHRDVVAPPRARESEARASARELPTVTVHRHDTLWGLAEKHLGKGTRYPEIFDLNRGREQPDGDSLRDPDLIMPGWIMRLPADARHLPTHAQTPVRGASAPASPAVEATTPAPSTPSDSPSTSCPTSAAPAVTERPESDDIGPAAEPVPVASTTAPSPSSPPATTAALPTTTEGEYSLVEADVAPIPSPGLLLGLGALTFTGLVGEVGRRRRRQRATRRTGERIPMPAGDVARTEARAASMAAPDTAELLDRTLWRLADECARTDRSLPDVRVVRAGSNAIDIELGRPESEPVPPFRAIDDTHWELDAAAPLVDDITNEAPGPYPVLVAVGVAGDRQVLLNLESVGTLQIAGPAPVVDGVLRAIAVDLAVGASTERCFPTFAACFEDLAEVLDPARTRFVPEPAAVERTLARRIADDVAVDRLAPHPDHDPADVVVTPHPARLAPGPYSGAVLISPADQATGFTLSISDNGTARLADGPAFSVQRLALKDFKNVVDLLATAGRSTSRLATSTPADPDDERLAVLEALPPTDIVATEPEHNVEAPRILLLGPVTITGATTSTLRERRRRLIELIAFLALHPGAYAHEIDEALWPGVRVERTTRNTTIHRARTWLGENPEGEPYLPRLRDRELNYELRPEVTCDWTDFQRLARRGLEKGTAGLPDLDEALSLVRGRPFFGVDPATYTWAEPVTQEMIEAISDVAHLASVTHLEAGAARSALRAAAIGLSADESSNLLLRDASEAARAAADSEAISRFEAMTERADAADDW